ncbi:MAG TPA: response regulator transcription factor [Cyclobacteriaceae bacterium]|nr:response regulator transcription factor [Cyclobacteriaceae bacterium]HMV10038.1 response regulator transcription factor [Cyclobacteriaceae bacterium]HMV89983.1 response regulator transcription factor [Cyclobacteriaceae bacterium]HMW99809.1 response regulator transcription factor [Cyclobacteriaceae bacterium]HMX50201.1 response regulator transcription factor [Cyclobacteriaceae bacterium]
MSLPFKKRVVIIEDDQEIRESFNLIVNSSQRFAVVGAYGNCEDAIAALNRDKPEIVLMDIELPGMNGIKGTQIIRDKNSSTEIIMVTVYEDSDLVFEALKAGASGYITKSANYTELLSALEEIVRGGAPMSSRIARMVIDNYHINPNSPLTKRETTILQLISEGKTYTQISEELFISKETAKTHIKNIYSKLQVNSKSEAIAKANHDKLI